MNLILTLFLLGSEAGMRVVAAPDQPIPHVYVDDPVIVEITAPRDMTCTVNVTVELEEGDAIELPAEPLALRANTPCWHVLEGIPVSRGLHTVRVRVDADGASAEHDAAFCRIDRPVTDGPVPVAALLRGGGSADITAVRGIPLQGVCVNAGAPQAADTLAAARDEGLGVTVVLDLEQEPDPAAAVGRLEESIGDAAASWVIDPAGSARQFMDAAAVPQREGTRPAVLLAVRDPETLYALLSEGAGRSLLGFAYRTDEPTAETLAALRNAAERAGCEGLRLHVLAEPADGTVFEGRQLVSQAVLSAAAGASWTAIDMGSLYDGERFSEGYARVSALAHELAGAVHAGELALSPGVSCHVFRSGTAWVAVMWSGEQQDVQINAGAATDVTAKDGRGNAVPVAAPVDGAVHVPVGPGAAYLRGIGGPVIADAARVMARREARGFVSNEEFARLLPAELLETIRHIASEDVSKPERLEFLALLKAFPLIEERWHAGALPKEIAVPAMASLQRQMRHLCVLEDALGEPFVEPVTDILARCGEYCSKYLTNSGDASKPPERGEAILDIVEGLTADAEALVAEGRVTEAGGVAALAEWRARSLEFAEKAHPSGEPGAEHGVNAPAETPADQQHPASAAGPGSLEKPPNVEPGAEPDKEPTPAKAEDAGEEAPTEGASDKTAQPKETVSPAEEAAGQPQADTEAAAEKPGLKKIIHVVKHGDNPWALGQKYGVDYKDIYKWNGWKSRHVLNVGDKVIIYTKEE